MDFDGYFVVNLFNKPAFLGMEETASNWNLGIILSE